MKYRVVFLFCFTAANIVLGAGACLAYDVSGADLFQSSSKLPAFTSPDQNTEMDPCAKAIQEKAEIISGDIELARQEELLKQELKTQKDVQDRALTQKSGDTLRLKSSYAPSVPRSTKFTSYFERDPEKDQFLKELNADLASFNEIAGMFSPSSGLGRINCLQGADPRICANVENDRKQLMRNLSSTFAARAKLLADLKDCVNTRKPFFDCKAANTSCSLMTLLNGTSQGDGVAQFKEVFRGILAQKSKSMPGINTDGDICRKAKEYYEAELGKYKSGKTAKIDTATGTNTQAVVSDAEKIDVQLARVEKPVKERATHIANLKKEQARLLAVYKKDEDACGNKPCATEIAITQKDWEITKEPRMPKVSATANGDLLWTFHLDYKLRTGMDCGLDIEEKGSNFDYDFKNSSLYRGGAYTLETRGLNQEKCGSSKKEFKGNILGLNPDPKQLQSKIREVFGGGNGGSPELANLALKIACQESGQRQFDAGLPYVSPPNDYGIFQISNDVSCVHAWNWIENIKTAKKMWGERFGEAKNKHHKSENNPNYSDNFNFIRCLSRFSEAQRKNRLPPELSSAIRKWSGLVKVYGKERTSELAIEFSMSELELETLKRYNGGRGTYYKVTNEELCSGSWELKSQRDYSSTDFDSSRDAKKYYIENVLSKSTECAPGNIFDSSVVKSRKVLKPVVKAKVKK